MLEGVEEVEVVEGMKDIGDVEDVAAEIPTIYLLRKRYSSWMCETTGSD